MQARLLALAHDPALLRTPALLFDAGAIADNARALADIGDATGVRFLFAVKSFPHPAALAVVGRALAGADVSNAVEARAARTAGFAPLVSLCSPGLHAALLDETLAELAGALPDGLLVSCETPSQARAARERGARVMVRLDSGSLLAPLFEGTKSKAPRSRFGVPARAVAVAPLLEAAGPAFEGFHLHHGFPQHNSEKEYLHFARGMLVLCAALGVGARTYNFGGGLWKMGYDELGSLCAGLRELLGPGARACFEPGRVLTRGAGWAVGTVVSARSLPDREIRVLDLSRVGHMKWSNSSPVVDLPVANASPSRFEINGPTCYEDDCFLRVPLAAGADASALLPEGARVVFEGVTGYSAAWNHSFNGLPAAGVVVT